jgi:hypothetical protein
VFELFALLLAAIRAAARRRGDLIAENLLLRHQLAVLTRPTRRRPRVRFRRLDQLLWVLVRRVRRDWRRHLVVVTPDTVLRWHRAGWRLYWRWRSRAGGGRPRLSPEIRDLIARMSQENPLWGAERIRGELRKLGIEVSNRSIRRYRWRPPGRPPSQTWRTFFRNHARATWAADLCVVQTLTFKTLYVLLFITGTLLGPEIEVQGVAVPDEVEEPPELLGRGRRVPGAPDAPEAGPGHQPAADEAQRRRPHRPARAGDRASGRARRGPAPRPRPPFPQSR